MLIYDKDKYDEVISDQTIQKIEREKGIKCLFGGAFSTRVYGIDNVLSDFDFYIIHEKGRTGAAALQYFNKETFQDIWMLDWEYVKSGSRNYLAKLKQYPSVLYRGYAGQHVFNTHRDDFTSQILFEILYSDYIWDSGFLKKNLNDVLEELSFLGILDYYFTRAYGNLKTNLSKKQVPAVKYLMAFLGYACLKWLLEYRTIPNMDFMSMVQLFAPDRYAGFLQETRNKHRELDAERDYRVHAYDMETNDLFSITPQEADKKRHIKEKKIVVINQNKDFNDWLEQELKLISSVMDRLANGREKVRIEKGNSAFLFRKDT